MKKLASYLLLLLAIGLIITAPLFGQSKRIGEIVEMSGMAATFSKNQPRGTIVLEESALELWYLFNYTPAGTTLGAASKVKISADALNGIYSGSDTIPNGTVAYVGDVMTFNGQVTIDGTGLTSATKGLQINSGTGANFSVNDAGEVDSRLGYWIGGSRIIHLTGASSLPVDQNFFGGSRAGETITTGLGNVGVGSRAFQYSSTVSYNTGVGLDVGRGLNNGFYNVFLGYRAGSGVDNIYNSAAIGSYAVPTGNSQFVTGSSTSSFDDYYFGRGVYQNSSNLGVVGVSFNATSIQAGEANASAASFPFSINGSRGTGTGVGGDILFKFAPAGASGSSQNTLQTALQITPTTERVVSHYTHQFNDGINFSNEASTWAYTEIEIGQWDMDATDSVLVAHPLVNWQSIRDVSIIVRNDADDKYYTLVNYNKNNRNSFDASYFYIHREATSFFDNANFDAVTDGGGAEYNRGWITFWYKV